ncbi:AIM24 family protein [Paenibacillus sp. GCM10012307]|uniref:AIM24 family protein n=1 Tax=Paenibacillus roseus TaxID=2798579 RepID=A0A934IY77_9BACL|nr:AIM24 family protein [Paenibacillus roseus]
MQFSGANEHTQSGHLNVKLTDKDKLHVLHPNQIIAYKGQPAGREDRFMDIKGMYRKRRWIRSKITGPAELLIALPPVCKLHVVPIDQESNLLFDFRSVLFFSDGMLMQNRLQSFKNALITKEWVRTKFTGPGFLGLLSTGFMESLELDEDTPLYVDAGCLLAYPEKAQIKLSVYGNSLASQHMRVQWELKGSGPVLIQTGASTDPQLEGQLRQDGFIRRTLREVLPFGGVFIK